VFDSLSASKALYFQRSGDSPATNIGDECTFIVNCFDKSDPKQLPSAKVTAIFAGEDVDADYYQVEVLDIEKLAGGELVDVLDPPVVDSSQEEGTT